MDQDDSHGRKDSEGLWDWNLESNRIHYSPRWISLAGCQDHEVGNTPEEWFQRVHPEDRSDVLREIEAVQAGESSQFDFRYRLRHKDGACRWMVCRGVVVRNDAGQAIRLRGSQSDVTVDTITDPQTGLPNRLLFLDRLTQSIDRAQRYKAFHFAVLLLDLCRPGNSDSPPESTTGDPLLTAAARRLETCLRIPDTPPPTLRHNDLVARVQGDQFAILLDGLKAVSHAKVAADRVLDEILAPFTLSGREVRVSASIGIAVSATGYGRADDVLRDAETALHRARVLGGSHCEVFDTAILKSEQTELQLEADLEQALERREFVLFYQPIVSLASNHVVGFEALVRWQHPVLGMIPPLDFIPIAERTGFIVRLGNRIVSEACLQLGGWQKSLPLAENVWMSVNLSPLQLRHPALIDEIGQALQDSGLEARSLVLELTEGAAMDNPTAVKTLLMRLRAMGIRISIDDFGTGYSSLAYLRQFPVDALKVDRSFVRGMETHKDTADIVGSLIAMARQLDLHVVAEGIENEDQLLLLRSLQCESAQGHFFARPLDARGATNLLSSGLPLRLEGARDEETGRSLQREERTLTPQDAARLAAKRRWVFAGATTASLLTLAAVVALFTSGPRPLVRSATPLPPVNSTGRAVGAPADSGVPFRKSNEVAAGAARTPAASVKPQQGLSAQSSAPPPAVATSDRTVVSMPERLSASVSHQHRVGSCHGRLIVSRDGVAFVPDDKAGKDAFALAYGDFLYTLAESILTIKSNARTYRFTTAAAVGKGDHEPQLRDVVERIARFRLNTNPAAGEPHR